MAIFNRYLQNPILRPTPLNDWESTASFNGTVIKENDIYYLFYRAIGTEKTVETKKVQMSTIGKATSKDGVHFDHRKEFIIPEETWEKYGCEDPRITKIDGKYFIFYTALSNYPPNHLSIKCAVAISEDLSSITEKHLVTPFNAKAMTLFPEKINDQYCVLLTVNTDKPPTQIGIARFKKIETLWDQKFWEDWYAHLEEHTLNLKRINSDQIEIGAPPLKTKYGWVLLYSYIKNYFYENKIFRIESVLLDENDPQKIIGRIEEPCLIPQEYYEYHGIVQNVIFPEGALIEDNEIKLYYGAADTFCCLATGKLDRFLENFNLNSPEGIKCEKFPNNPLLQPIPEHQWENMSVCNPTTVKIENKVFLIYRAVSDKNVSTFGCAVSHDGYFIDERLPEPIYVPRTKWELSEDKKNCGCEDPRATVIGDKIYVVYTAYDGKLPRLALTSIHITDFLNRDWSKWSDVKIISAEGIPDKDGCLMPEKINDQYIFFHRVEPNIIVDCVDDLDFKNGKVLDSSQILYPGSKFWDGIKIGVNTPPIKTKYGWLTFYHGISQVDKYYRVGAILFDLVDINKVIARTPYPILEPELWFEKSGVVDNVVFPCGAVEMGDDVFIYYGGADKVVCGAKINLENLLNYLLNTTTKKYLTVS